MILSTKKLKLISLFLLTATLSFGQSNTSALLPLPNHIEQVTGKKNFTVTPQTVVKTNLPKQAFCLFELQRILRDRVGQSAIMGGFQASAVGISAALVFGYLASLIFQPKMKE